MVAQADGGGADYGFPRDTGYYYEYPLAGGGVPGSEQGEDVWGALWSGGGDEQSRIQAALQNVDVENIKTKANTWSQTSADLDKILATLTSVQSKIRDGWSGDDADQAHKIIAGMVATNRQQVTNAAMLSTGLTNAAQQLDWCKQSWGHGLGTLDGLGNWVSGNEDRAAAADYNTMIQNINTSLGYMPQSVAQEIKPSAHPSSDARGPAPGAGLGVPPSHGPETPPGYGAGTAPHVSTPPPGTHVPPPSTGPVAGAPPGPGPDGPPPSGGAGVPPPGLGPGVPVSPGPGHFNPPGLGGTPGTGIDTGSTLAGSPGPGVAALGGTPSVGGPPGLTGAPSGLGAGGGLDAGSLAGGGLAGAGVGATGAVGGIDGAGAAAAAGRGMVPMQGGPVSDEEERERNTWLVEDDDVWGASDAPPGTIG
jgi:uncharacterized protein YukE